MRSIKKNKIKRGSAIATSVLLSGIFLLNSPMLPRAEAQLASPSEALGGVASESNASTVEPDYKLGTMVNTISTYEEADDLTAGLKVGQGRGKVLIDGLVATPNMDDANGASVSNGNPPSGYQANSEAERFTFGYNNIDTAETAEWKATNPENYYFRYSMDYNPETKTVKAELIKKADHSVMESHDLEVGESVEFTTFQVQNKPLVLKYVDEAGIGRVYITVDVRDKEIQVNNWQVPKYVVASTKYKDMDGNDLAVYSMLMIEGQTVTVSNQRDFTGYSFVKKEEKVVSLYPVGTTYVNGSIPGRLVKRLAQVADEDGGVIKSIWYKDPEYTGDVSYNSTSTEGFIEIISSEVMKPKEHNSSLDITVSKLISEEEAAQIKANALAKKTGDDIFVQVFTNGIIDVRVGFNGYNASVRPVGVVDYGKSVYIQTDDRSKPGFQGGIFIGLENDAPTSSRSTYYYVKTTPTAIPSATKDLQGRTQVSKVIFDVEDTDDTSLNFLKGKKGENGQVVEVDLDKSKLTLVDDEENEVKELSVDGEGTYKIVGESVTFTPNADFIGTAKPVRVKITDVDGNVASTTYTPTVLPVGSVIVEYKDNKGKTIEDSEIVKTNEAEGVDYTTEAKEIKGYTLIASPSNASGKVTKGLITVTYIYEPDVQRANIKYVDITNSIDLLEDSISGGSGEKINYTTEEVLKNLRARGYALVDDGFTTISGRNYDYDKDIDQDFVVKLRMLDMPNGGGNGSGGGGSRGNVIPNTIVPSVPSENNIPRQEEPANVPSTQNGISGDREEKPVQNPEYAQDIMGDRNLRKVPKTADNNMSMISLVLLAIFAGVNTLFFGILRKKED